MRSFAQPAFVDEDNRAPLAEGFFNPRPRDFIPLPGHLLVAIERVSDGTLAGPVELAQNARDVVLVVTRFFKTGLRREISRSAASLPLS